MSDEAQAQVELLDQNLKKTHVLSSRMTGILTHFDSRLNRLEKTILPLHNSTQSLTRLGTNIDATLAALVAMRSSQDKASIDDSVILGQPNPNDLTPYMSTLNRSLENIENLKASGLRSGDPKFDVSIRTAVQGYQSLCQVLKQLVQDGSKTGLSIDAVLRSTPRPGDHFPTHSSIVSSKLANYLVTCSLATSSNTARASLDDAFRVWGEVRGAWMRRAVESYGRDVLNGSSNSTGGSLAEAVLVVAKSEHLQLVEVLPMGSPFVLQTLKEIVSPSVAQLSSVLPALVASLRTESQPWEAYVLYEQIMGVSKGWEDFFASSGLAGVGAAEDGEGALRKVLNGPLKGLCLRSLPEAVEGAKASTRPGEQPLSASVLSNTVDAVDYLLKIPEHQDIIETLLLQLGDRKWLMGASNMTPSEEGGVLEHFTYDIAAALLQSLEQKAKGMRRGTGGAMLVNNVSYVRNKLVLEASVVSDLLGDEGEDLLNRAFRSAKAAYLEPYQELVSNLAISNSPLPPSSTSRLKSPLPSSSNAASDERQQTKDGFVRFWDGLDALESMVRASPRLSIGSEGKDRLREEVVSLVSRAYRAAVSRAGSSLGPKYIRASPDDVDRRINALFQS